jgi:hypothetical protein
MKASKMMWIVLVVMMLGAAAPSFAATTATADAGGTITVALAVTNTGALEFGAVIPDPDDAGSVEITTGDARNCTTVTGVNTQAHFVPKAAAFHVVGAALASYSISLPTSNVTLSHGGDSMVIIKTTFTQNATGVLDASGVEDFKVGATLPVGAAQAPGRYTGSFTVGVAYE